MNIFEAVILGLLQGLTEFLPISSSGHLVVVEALLNLQVGEYLFFDVLLHLATLIAICLYFRKRLSELVRVLFFSSRENALTSSQFDRLLVLAIFVSTIITGLIGVWIKPHVVEMRHQVHLVGITFIVTGFFLLSTLLRKTVTSTNPYNVPINIWIFALLMGAAQGIAILPGISRSGTTVSMALLLGVTRTLAVEYSFLISIPAILGATLLELKDAELSIGIIPAAFGFMASLFSSLVFLWVLVWIVRKGLLHQFAYYLIPLGILVLFFL